MYLLCTVNLIPFYHTHSLWAKRAVQADVHNPAHTYLHAESTKADKVIKPNVSSLAHLLSSFMLFTDKCHTLSVIALVHVCYLCFFSQQSDPYTEIYCPLFLISSTFMFQIMPLCMRYVIYYLSIYHVCYIHQ